MTVLRNALMAATALATFAAMAPAHGEQGDFLVRARAVYITPDESAETSIGGTVNIGTDTVPELDFTYFVTDKLALELILATNEHAVTAVGTALGDVPLGDITLLPPTLTLQYHPLAGETFSPYVGAGVNLTLFYDADLPAGGVITDIDYDTSVGFALQAGFDVMITDNMFFNVDAKKLFLGTNVDLNGGGVTANVDIDPWILGAGIGFKF